MPIRRQYPLICYLSIFLLAACAPSPGFSGAVTVAPGGPTPVPPSPYPGRPGGAAPGISAAAFAGAEFGMLAADASGASILMMTTDGGATWEKNYGSSSPIVALDFVSPRQGWFATATTLFATQDAGLNWKPVPVPGVEQILRADFADAAHGWVYGLAAGNAVLARTADGGTAWNAATLPAGSESAAGWISFTSPTAGWFLAGTAGDEQCQGEALRLWQTRDGGATWQAVAGSVPAGGGEQPAPETPAAYPAGGGDAAGAGSGCPSGLAFVDERHGWLTLSYGGLYVTADGGKSWTAVKPPAEGEQLPALPCPITPDDGYVVYGNAVLWRVAGGGGSWDQVYPRP